MDSTSKPYEARLDSDNKPFVAGPAPGGECSYHGGTLYPETRFSNEDDASRAAQIANIAFAMGRASAQADIRKSLGL